MPVDYDNNIDYIIESPSKRINFAGITNGDCKYSTVIHIDSIDSGITLETLGLTQTPTDFEPDPPAGPLETFRVIIDP